MDALKEVLIFFENHTISFVITAILILFLVKIGNFYLNHIEENLKLKKHNNKIEETNKINVVIDDLIEKVRMEARACRSYVFQFRNGDYYLGGMAKHKMDCTNEKLNPNGKVSSEKESRQDLPFNLFGSFVDMLQNNDYLVIDINNKTEDYDDIVYGTLSKRNTIKTVRVKIVNLKGWTIGCFCLDYCNEKESNNFEEEKEDIIKIAKNTATQLGAILSMSVKKKEG